jgi:hypothetical protein
MSSPRILFILKRRDSGPAGEWNYSADGSLLDSGLSVSATQMTYVLEDMNVDVKLVQVIDNNCIDREVTQYRPTHVIIEAFWVVPDKFDVLRKLHPTVKWIIRNHSKSDFLSHEGGMVGWAIDYISKGLILGCNSREATADFKRLAKSVGADPQCVQYLPNYYRANEPRASEFRVLVARFLRFLGFYGRQPALKEFLEVGCFGAIRPLKNHLHQAMAAIEAAEALGMKLRFSINGTRIEGKAQPILTSLRQLFKRYPQHQLVELPWMNHATFIAFTATMDIVLQVSNSETFNIVAADAVSNHVPVLVSDEIPWLDHEFHADPNSVTDIAWKLVHIYRGSGNGLLQDLQLIQLHEYCENSREILRKLIEA